MKKWLRRDEWPRTRTDLPGLGPLIAGISTLYEARPRLLAELRRARRHERPLTLLTLAPDGSSLGFGSDGRDGAVRAAVHPAAPNGSAPRPGPADDPGVLHLELFVVGILLRETLRESDLVALSLDDPGYAVLLPETAGAAARAAAFRIDEVIRSRTAVTVRVGAARFPQDGFTIEDLLGTARYAWVHRPLVPGEPERGDEASAGAESENAGAGADDRPKATP